MRKETRSKKKNITEDRPSNATTDQRGTKESPLLVDIDGHKDSPSEAKEKARAKKEKNDIDTWTLRWAGITAGATVILMIVGIGGVCAALHTLNVIRRQVALQELTMQQWVYLTNWNVKKLQSDPSKLRIRVNLVNQSGFPLILNEGGLLIEEIGGSTRHEIGDETFLPPNTPLQIEIVVTPTPGQLPEFDKGSLSFRVAGGFSHIDRISGKKIVQPVNGSLACGWWGAVFHGELHMNPVESDPPRDGAEG